MTFFRNLKTSSKLIVSFLCVIVCVAILGGIAISRVGEMRGNLQTLYDDRLVPVIDLDKVNGNLSYIRIGALRIMNEQDASKRQNILNEAADDEKEIDALIQKYGATYLTPDEKKTFDEFRPAWKAYNDSRLNTYKWALDGEFEKAKHNAATDAAAKFKVVDEKLKRLIAIQDEVGKELYKQAENDYAFIRNLIIVVTLIVIAIAIIFVVILTKMIAAPLTEITVNVANKLADGDLTVDVEEKGKDEIGQLSQAMKNMVVKLREVMGNARNISDNVASGSEELSASAQQISQGTTEQAASIEETTSSMEQMVANIRQNADNAQQT
ncbi:MAG: MCP four helix bundle domain-containing protein, partial [Deltaproteobacteria bacterium]|nr:MCP four helix bundle domain-containing protein [Deltaproteobacteria bacterium]